MACGVAMALGLAASPAGALAPRYSSGAYTGSVSQSVPQAYAGSIGFRIRAGFISKLQFKVTMVCGKLLVAQVQSPPSDLRVRVGADGTFSYAGTVSGTLVKLVGKVHNRNASGTFFESFHTSPANVCTMFAPAPFGAGA